MVLALASRTACIFLRAWADLKRGTSLDSCVKRGALNLLCVWTEGNLGVNKVFEAAAVPVIPPGVSEANPAWRSLLPRALLVTVAAQTAAAVRSTS